MNSSIQDGSHDKVNRRVIRHNESIALAILDLPIGSAINVDGIAIILQRCDFVHCTGIVWDDNDDGDIS